MTEVGVDPVCRVLKLSPSTYFARKNRPEPVRRITRALRREGHEVARCTVERLMAEWASRASSAAGAAALRSRSRRRRGRRTWSTATSLPPGPTSCGWRIRRTSAPGRAGHTGAPGHLVQRRTPPLRTSTEYEGPSGGIAATQRPCTASSASVK
ncbi:IS3 family transposase [Streptomyces sp. NPDC017230]|uniref:IS3 family transposase n=1 Tax=unclassified Streptomyces TaxID=2593676 RepID=UPI00378B40B8